MRRYLAILATDFLYWLTAAGMTPLLSRMIQARLGEQQTNQMVSWMILSGTVFSLLGRFVAGRSMASPKRFLRFGTTLSTLALLLFFLENPRWWLFGRALQGFALGSYAVAILTCTSLVLPRARQFKGFAMIGMADFLGFSFGPVLSGLLQERIGYHGTLLVFLVAVAATQWTSGRIRLEPAPEEDDQAPPPPQLDFPLKAFIPLSLGVFFGLLYHIFFSNYLPIQVKTTQLPVETVFFAGYVVGGIAFRIRLIDLFTRFSGPLGYGVAILALAGTVAVMAYWPLHSAHIDLWVALSGLAYGMGLEALYIFTLAWVSAHTVTERRNRAYAMVFSGIDLSSLIGGLFFGVLTNLWGIQGLQRAMLSLLPLFLALPFWIAWNFKDPGTGSSAPGGTGRADLAGPTGPPETAPPEQSDPRGGDP